MKNVIIIKTSQNLRTFRRDFKALADTVRAADGKYVMYEVTPSATLPSIISKADFDRVVSAEMHGEPSAFSKRIAGGRFTQDRLDRAYGALARKALKNSIAEHGRSKILSRREYLDYYNLNIFRRH